MANTIKITNRTIEISDIDSDYMMDQNIDVQSVVLIPGTAAKLDNYVNIIENSIHDTDPVKVLLISSISKAESRMWIFNQRLQLGFVYNNCVFETGAKVIFNIGEIKFGNNYSTTQMKMQFSAENVIL